MSSAASQPTAEEVRDSSERHHNDPADSGGGSDKANTTQAIVHTDGGHTLRPSCCLRKVHKLAVADGAWLGATSPSSLVSTSLAVRPQPSAGGDARDEFLDRGLRMAAVRR